MSNYRDSSNKPVVVGDTVLWRGERYTVKGFRPNEGRHGTAAIDFDRPPHRPDEVPDEISIDVVNPHELLSSLVRGLADPLRHSLDGSGLGFALILFDFGEDGTMAYAADGERAGVIRMLRELADKLEADLA